MKLDPNNTKFSERWCMVFIGKEIWDTLDKSIHGIPVYCYVDEEKRPFVWPTPYLSEEQSK